MLVAEYPLLSPASESRWSDRVFNTQSAPSATARRTPAAAVVICMLMLNIPAKAGFSLSTTVTPSPRIGASKAASVSSQVDRTSRAPGICRAYRRSVSSVKSWSVQIGPCIATAVRAGAIPGSGQVPISAARRGRLCTVMNESPLAFSRSTAKHMTLLKTRSTRLRLPRNVMSCEG
jgi:hypothetical protein